MIPGLRPVQVALWSFFLQFDSDEFLLDFNFRFGQATHWALLQGLVPGRLPFATLRL